MCECVCVCDGVYAYLAIKCLSFKVLAYHCDTFREYCVHIIEHISLDSFHSLSSVPPCQSVIAML